MGLFQILDVDSEIFGFPVAKIIPDTMTRRGFTQLISRLKKEKVRLAFWASNPQDEESQRAAQACQGFLADKKVTYAMDIRGLPERSVSIHWHIEEYTDTIPCAELDNLAIQIGKNSRFSADHHIPERVCFDMYRLWIRNSVNRQVADAVFVSRQSGKVVGMVTVGAKNG
ncbi:MAG: hypothetical protein L7F78_08870, partial [Syntrophales bacterium LBB04]|nr:hypothetical protein [Syntrophales bacterium LBB04]